MTIDVISQPDTPAPRKASRASRREQLIEATIETLANCGLSRTTLTEVAGAAGLSHGLVNFHFQSKERLLAETLLYLAAEYRENWTRAPAAAGPSPAERLDALIRADFAPAISTPARLKAWCAFWGEAQSRPAYQQTCGTNDRLYVATLESICAALIAETGAAHDPARVARILRVTIEGTWLDLITMRTP
jgi:TetR/AcrR family transcriptional repressor of bet genes